MFYLLIVSLGILLLNLPISHQQGVDIKTEDVAFTVASAFSDTGLVTEITSTTWSNFGQAIIACLILTGGLGFFALRVFIINIIFKLPITFSGNEIASSERGSVRIGYGKNLIKISISIMLSIILVFSIVLSLYFYFTPVEKVEKLNEIPYHNVTVSMRFGIFHTISALNNAGFDIMGKGSESISAYYNFYGLQLIFIFLFVLGGIGYPVIYDVYLWIKSRFTKDLHRWKLFTKISVVTYFLITLFSIGIVFLIETQAHDLPDKTTFWNDPSYGTHGNKSMALVFNTMSTRNAGFSTIKMHNLTNPSLILYSILMFIGSSPSSTAGGIRTTTFAILILALWHRLRNKDEVTVFSRRIGKVNVANAQIVFFTSTIILILGTMLASSSFYQFGGNINAPGSGERYSFTELIFEVASAFGTTGLSAGITSEISLITKITLIIIMFIGQLGVSTTLLIGGKNNTPRKTFSYIKEEVQTG